MRLGLVPPVVNRNPRFDPPAWEERAGIAELAEVARAADRLGYDFICFPGHVAIPAEVARGRGGGRTPRSLRRARELGDGWCPFGLTIDGLEPMLDARRAGIAERGADFDVVLSPEPPLDPLADPDDVARVFERYGQAGATRLNL